MNANNWFKLSHIKLLSSCSYGGCCNNANRLFQIGFSKQQNCAECFFFPFLSCIRWHFICLALDFFSPSLSQTQFQSVSGVIIIKPVDSVLNANYSKSCHHFSSRKPNAMFQNTLLMPMLRKCILEPNRRCNTEITDAFIMFQSTLDLIAQRMKNTFSHSHTHTRTHPNISANMSIKFTCQITSIARYHSFGKNRSLLVLIFTSSPPLKASWLKWTVYAVRSLQ